MLACIATLACSMSVLVYLDCRCLTHTFVSVECNSLASTKKQQPIQRPKRDSSLHCSSFLWQSNTSLSQKRIQQLSCASMLQVVRFWAQHLIKLATSFRKAGHTSWACLAALLAQMHAHMPLVRSATLYSNTHVASIKVRSVRHWL